MARYIDADKLIEECRYYDTEDDLKTYVKAHGYADVVSKSEYDRLEKLFKDMTQEAKGYLNRLYGIRTDVAIEIFEELNQKRNELWNKGNYTMFECWCKAEEEVKKKYTGGGAK